MNQDLNEAIEAELVQSQTQPQQVAALGPIRRGIKKLFKEETRKATGKGLEEAPFADVMQEEIPAVQGALQEMEQESMVGVPQVEGQAKKDFTGQEEAFLLPEKEIPIAPQELVDRALQGQPPENLVGRTKRRNINLNHFNDPETKEMIELMNKLEGGYKDQEKRRTVTHAETIERSKSDESLARVLGAKPDDKWEPEDLVNIYNMLDTMAYDLKRKAKDIDDMDMEGLPTDEALAEFQILGERFNALQELAAGRAAEAGRMLNAMKAISKTTKGREYHAAMGDVLMSSGGSDIIMQRVRLLNEAKTLPEMARVVKESWADRAWARITQIRYNLMLSSMRTHVANITGSSMTGIYENLLVRPLTSVNSEAANVFNMMTKGEALPRDQRVTFSDSWYQIRAATKAVADATHLSKEILQGKELGEGKVFNEMGIRYSASNVPESMLGKVGTLPTRALEAEDAWFRSIYYNSRLEELVHKRAIALGETKEEQQALYEKMMETPPKDISDKAREYSQKLTFTNDPSLYGKVIGDIAKKVRDVQQGSVLGRAGRLIFPFVQTPANVTGYALEATTGGLTSPSKTFGLLTKGSPEEKAEAMARMEIAAGMWVLGYQLWEQGIITGAQADWGKERGAIAGGYRSNSIKIGDKYYDLTRTDPLGLTLNIIATGYNIANNDPNWEPTELLLLVGDLVADRSMLAGYAELTQAFNYNNQEAFERLANQIVMSHTTAGFSRDLRMMTDPYQRQAGTVDDSANLFDRWVKGMKNTIPFLSDEIPPSVDAHGNPVKNPNHWLVRGTIPILSSELNQDPVAAAYIATNMRVPAPSKEIQFEGGRKFNLLALDGGQGWLYYKYQKMVGQERHKLVKAIVTSKEWENNIVKNNLLHEGAAGYDMIKKALRDGSQIGKVKFLEWLDGKSEFEPSIDGVRIGRRIKIERPFSLDEYMTMRENDMNKSYGEPYDEEWLETLDKEGIFKPDRYNERKGLPDELKIQPEF